MPRVARSVIEPLAGFAGLALAWQLASLIAHNPTLVPPLGTIGAALTEARD